VKLIIKSPASVQIHDYVDKLNSLDVELSVTNTSLQYQLQKFKKNRWYAEEHGVEAFQEAIAEKKAACHRKLMVSNEDGTYETLSGFVPRLVEGYEATVENLIQYPAPEPMKWVKAPHSLRPYQAEGVEKLLEAKHGAVSLACHGKGQKLLMFDGSLKAVEDIVVGDKLMGNDSTARNVLSLKRGRDTMYRVTMVNGQSYLANGNHLMYLTRTKRRTRTSNRAPIKSFLGDNPTTVLTINDYIEKPKFFKHLWKHTTEPVTSWVSPEWELSPYHLGILLGDGGLMETPNITTADSEIEEEIAILAKGFGLKAVPMNKSNFKNKSTTWSLSSLDLPRIHDGVDRRFNRNPLTKILRGLGVYGLGSGDKFIPNDYKISSIQDRLDLLAGLIDTDGSLIDGCFDYVSKSKRLAEDVAFVARSVGLRVNGPNECQKSDQHGTIGTYFRLYISGDTDRIQCRVERKRARSRQQIKNPKMFGFKVEKLSDSEEFYGFELDGNHLYLTDTFLVTHNTGLGKTRMLFELTHRLGLKTVIMTPSTKISEQIYLEAVQLFGKSKVGQFFDRKKESDKQIVVANGQSLTKIKEDSVHWENLCQTKVFISDESHSCPAATFEKVCLGLLADTPYRFFFSATQTRGDGLKKLLEGITGPVVYEMDAATGIAQGWLAVPTFAMMTVESNDSYYSSDVLRMNQRHLFYNQEVIQRIASVVNDSVSKGLPTLVLLEEIEQFNYLLQHLRHKPEFAHGGNAEEGRLPAEYQECDTTDQVNRFNSGECKLLIGTSCISTGVDILPARVLIYWQGGKSEIQVKQAIGRGVRKHTPTQKETFFVLDFDVKNIDILSKHAQQRTAYYEEIQGPVKVI